MNAAALTDAHHCCELYQQIPSPMLKYAQISLHLSEETPLRITIHVPNRSRRR
jgi:hypothetical protein